MVQGLPIPEGEGTEGRWSEKTILDYAFRILQGLSYLLIIADRQVTK